MTHAQAESWWTEVEHLREPLEVARREREEAEVAAAEEDRARVARGRIFDGRDGERSPLRRSEPVGARRTIRIRGQVSPLPTRRLRAHDELSVEPGRAVAAQGVEAGSLPSAAPADPIDFGAAAERRRRPLPRASERIGARPDRLALWAVGLALLLILIAASSH